jgi:polyisoprenyl-phosphate glycosyltransferase
MKLETSAPDSVISPVISIVIPCRNEEANVREITAAVVSEMESIGVSFEIILIDNASQDTTVALAREICAVDPRIKLIVNTRNFGQMRSPTHAVFQAKGQAVIAMCADFQDPPELIGRFVELWRAGAPVVLGVRESEKTTLFLKWWRSFSYWFARRFGDYAIIPNATGFGLYDAKVIRTIAAIKEPEPFFRGILVETGYPIETILYPRPPRAGGQSNNNFFSLLDFAMSSLAGSSKKLLRVPFLLGIISSLVAVISLIIALTTLFTENDATFWFLSAAIEFQLALLFLVLGVMGDQIRLISERTRKTPLVVEQERVNFPDDE